MKIGIVGLGAIGVSLAQRLVGSGLAVTGFSRSGCGDFQIAYQGLTRRFSIEAHSSIPQVLLGQFDLLILCLKNHVLLDVFDRHVGLLRPDGVIACAQNGLMESLLVERFPVTRLLGAQVKAACHLDPPDRISMTRPLTMVLGPMERGLASRAPLRAILRAFGGLRFVKPTMDIRPYKWTKLLFSCVYNPLTSIMGLEADRLHHHEGVRYIMWDVFEEALQVAEREGVRLAFEGPFHPLLLRKAGPLLETPQKLLLGLFSRFLRGMKTSMRHDLELGRRTEIDFLNGVLVDMARRHRVALPFNATTVEIIKRMEKGEVEPGLDNVRLYDCLPRRPVRTRRSPLQPL